jgi:FKBP-type peptidyl-prolyl cis-trans isomerase (trigger factor)
MKTEPENTKLATALESMLPRITEEVAAELRKRTLEKLEWQVSEQVQSEIKTYISERILPNVQSELAAHEAEIKAIFVESIRQCFALAAAQMVDTAKKKIAGYDGDKMLQDIVAKMLGRGY